MSSVLGLLVLALISYLGSIYIFSKHKLPPLLRYLFFSGWEFMLLGIAIGPMALDLFPEEMLKDMEVVIYLGLGWVGLLVGIQMRFRDFAKLDVRHLKITVLQALLTGLVTGLAAYAMLPLAKGWNGDVTYCAVLVTAAAFAISSPTVLALVRMEMKFRERMIRLLQVITNLDAVVSALAVGIAFTFLRHDILHFKVALAFLAQALATGVLLGFLFHALPREELSEKEQLTVMAGFVFFSSGVGAALNVSPLFINLVCGIFLANRLKGDDRIYKAIFHTERPFYVIMLVLAGMIYVPSLFAVGVAIALALVRLAGKYYFVYRLIKRYDPGFDFPSNGGLALTSQGAMALIIGFAFLTVDHGSASRLVFSVIVTSMMMNEIAAPLLVSRTLKEG